MVFLFQQSASVVTVAVVAVLWNFEDEGPERKRIKKKLKKGRTNNGNFLALFLKQRQTMTIFCYCFENNGKQQQFFAIVLETTAKNCHFWGTMTKFCHCFEKDKFP